MRAAIASCLLLAAAAACAGEAVDPRSLAPGETWSVPGLRFEDGSAIRVPLELRRFDPYAAGARIWLVEGKRRTQVARSERVLLVSTRNQTDERLFLSLDPDGSGVRGASLTLSGLREFEGRRVDGRIVVARSKAVRTDAGGFQCGNDTASLEPFPCGSAS